MKRRLRFITICLVAALIGPFLEVTLHPGSLQYINPPPANFQAMSYEEQQQWFAANSRRVSGPELFMKRVGDTQFYIEYLRSSLIYFFVVAVSGIALGRWAQKNHAL